jgi:hypothetical protein
MASFPPVSLAGISAGVSTTTPNATIPIQSLSANITGYTNIDFAIFPKGTGSFSLAIADGTSLGGNKRGLNAVDLQTSRGSASQVVSGNSSSMIGSTNTVSGSNSFAAGNGNTVSGAYSFAIGSSNNISSVSGYAFGDTNIVTGQSGFCIGAVNTANAYASTAIGLRSLASVVGQVAFGHSSDSLGRYQVTFTGIRQATVGTTSTKATADSASGSSSNQLSLRNNSAVKFTGSVVALDIVTLDAKEWQISGLIKRGANAAATSLVGSPTAVSNFGDTNTTTWALVSTADTTNGCLSVSVTGAGTNTIRWMIQIQAYEVTA